MARGKERTKKDRARMSESEKGDFFFGGGTTRKSTEHGEVLEQTAVVTRCPASFIRFGPQVVGAAGLFLFNARAPAMAAAVQAVVAAAATTTIRR